MTRALPLLALRLSPTSARRLQGLAGVAPNDSPLLCKNIQPSLPGRSSSEEVLSSERPGFRLDRWRQLGWDEALLHQGRACTTCFVLGVTRVLRVNLGRGLDHGLRRHRLQGASYKCRADKC